VSLIADPITARFQACFWFMGMLVCLTCIYPLPAQGAQTPPEPENGTLTINLYEAILLSLRNNRTVTSAYMDRVKRKFQYAQAMAKFSPDIEITGNAGIQTSRSDTKYYGDTSSSNSTNHQRTEASSANIEGTIKQKIPTGGEFTFTWSGGFAKSWTTRPADNQAETKDWSASFTQPLLKGAGIDYNTASIKQADMDEQENLLTLRNKVIDTVTDTITKFRSLLEARKNLENQKESLEQACEQLRINKLLIETGRMAESEIYETQANVAQQELSYEDAINDLDAARLDLLGVLDMDASLKIDPIMDVNFKPIEPEFETCLAMAMANSLTMISKRNSVKRAELDLMQAKNERLWDVNLKGEIGQTKSQLTPGSDSRRDQWSVGAEVTAPFHIYGDNKYGYEKMLIQARIGLHTAQINLKEAEDNMRTSILNAVRNVHSNLKRVKLARQSLRLSEKAFETDKLKLRLGRISNKDFITSQRTLNNAKEKEISTIIDYLNTLTSLDRTLATTLDTYKIAFQPTRPEVEEKYMGRLQWMLNQ
jgi:outer membrane protein TolC